VVVLIAFTTSAPGAVVTVTMISIDGGPAS